MAVYVGYYDTHHTDQPKPKPSIWQGSSNTVFPYGNAYDPAKCNGADYPKAAGTTTIAGGDDAMCISDQGTAAPSQRGVSRNA